MVVYEVQNSMDITAKPIPCEHVVCTDFDTEGVIVDLNTKKYYQLNETAMFIWQQLEKGRTVGEIISAMTDVYDVSVNQATESVQKLLSEMRSSNLIKVS
jgi:hypothetical protein